MRNSPSTAAVGVQQDSGVGVGCVQPFCDGSTNPIQVVATGGVSTTLKLSMVSTQQANKPIYSANVTYLCIKLIQLFRRSFVDCLLEVGDETVEFLDSRVAAFPTWQSCVKTKQTQLELQ